MTVSFARLKPFSISERSFNAGVGLSVCSWAVLGLLASGDGALGSPVRWGIALLNLLVGGLFLIRQPVRAHGGVADIVQALPALVVAGLVFKLAPPPGDWPIFAEALLLGGVGLAGWSFFTLGRSFAVLPARRGIVTAGPYRWVRHPAYLGELAMVLGCAAASGRWLGYVVFSVGIVMVLVRVRAEERLLANDPGYRAYRECVPDALIPGFRALCSFARGPNKLYKTVDSPDTPRGSPSDPSSADRDRIEPEPGAPT